MPQMTFSERELEDFLANEKNLLKYLGLRYIARQVKTKAGIIDILAYSKYSKSFVIIELKKDALEFSAYEQVHRYQHALNVAYNTDYKKKYKKFTKLIVGMSLHPHLYYLVKHYESDCDYNQTDTYYALFGVSFDSPLSFTWYNPAQSEIEAEVPYIDFFEGQHA